MVGLMYYCMLLLFLQRMEEEIFSKKILIAQLFQLSFVYVLIKFF